MSLKSWRDTIESARNAGEKVRGSFLATMYIIIAICQCLYQLYTIIANRKHPDDPNTPPRDISRPLFPDVVDREPAPPVGPPTRTNRIKDLIDRIKNR